MDTDQNKKPNEGQADTQNSHASSTQSLSSTQNAEAGTAAPTMDELMHASSLPTSMCDWISCMRKAGISLTYSLEKRHIPDMNQPPSASSGGKKSGGPAGNPAPSSADSDAQIASTIGSIDTMTASGTCRIRYFDLILGAVGIFAGCVLIKCCCCMKRKMF